MNSSPMAASRTLSQSSRTRRSWQANKQYNEIHCSSGQQRLGAKTSDSGTVNEASLKILLSHGFHRSVGPWLKIYQRYSWTIRTLTRTHYKLTPATRAIGN